MKVGRNFEALYRANEDPWAIGDARTPRYDAYIRLIGEHAHGEVLDIGAGSGAFLARLETESNSLHAVDVSAKAVEIGRQRFPKIRFHFGSADRLDEIAGLRAGRFDLIICSDVIYYLDHAGRQRLLQWIAEHLTEDGTAFVAAWAPGGRYLTRDELDDLVVRNLRVVQRQFLADSQHYACVCKRRAVCVALTIDYETWHPIPHGKTIDWGRDIFQPTEALLELAMREGVPLTFFVEIGEYFWLCDNAPDTAARMRKQWQQIAAAGHDLQLHLHPSWLPELGARHAGGSKWHWDWSKAKIDDYPGDVAALIRRGKAALENVVRTVRASHRVSIYRAGAYQAQPFPRLHAALVENGFEADSSVFPGAISGERGYDYSLAHSAHQPYFASPRDAQLLAPPSEARLVELPVFAFERGRRASLDGEDARQFASYILRFEHRYRRTVPPELQRLCRLAVRIAQEAYTRMQRARGWINRLLPKSIAQFLTDYRDTSWQGDRYYTVLGHTKSRLNFDALRSGIRELSGVPGLRFVTMSEAAGRAGAELAGQQRTRTEEQQYQVQRETAAVLGEQRNFAQSAALQVTIPLDRSSILDFGCGAGYWSDRISTLMPWAKVVGVDAGLAFVRKAGHFRRESVNFCCADFLALPFASGTFDCIYADNTLEHAWDVGATLKELRRVITDDGVLVAAIPSDARNPHRPCDNHTWKTHPADVRARLGDAGFAHVDIREVDTYRGLSMAPYPPSCDQMMLIKAWASEEGGNSISRAVRAMDWLYQRVLPTKSNLSHDAAEIIRSGASFCMGYAIALGQLLRREGYDIRWVTMEAADHERGRGLKRLDTHEIVSVTVAGEPLLLDPTTNTVFRHSLGELLRDPSLADRVANRDERCAAHGFDLYNTSYWYRRVVRFALRPTLAKRDFRWTTVRNS